jgi:hypothetical protein
MLAITMEHAVRKPTLRGGVPHSALECSATVFIAVSTIAELAGAANGLEVTLEFMLATGWRGCSRGPAGRAHAPHRGAATTRSRITELSEVIPGISLQVA